MATMGERIALGSPTGAHPISAPVGLGLGSTGFVQTMRVIVTGLASAPILRQDFVTETGLVVSPISDEFGRSPF